MLSTAKVRSLGHPCRSLFVMDNLRRAFCITFQPPSIFTIKILENDTLLLKLRLHKALSTAMFKMPVRQNTDFALMMSDHSEISFIFCKVCMVFSSHSSNSFRTF